MTVALITIVGLCVAMAGVVAVDAARRVTRRRGLGGLGWFMVCISLGPVGVASYLVKLRRRAAEKAEDSALGAIDRRPDWDDVVQREHDGEAFRLPTPNR